MTSSNVIEYSIFDKFGKSVGHHRQNLMCKENYEPLMKFQPFSDYLIQAYGYDEDDEIWEDEPIELSIFLSGYLKRERDKKINDILKNE